MNTYEIIKKSISLPFRAYKGFSLVIFLFFVSEMFADIVIDLPIDDTAYFKFLSMLFVSMTILGINIAIAYHYIYDSFNIRTVSIVTTTKVGVKDFLIESYYYFLAISGTVIISYLLGIYKDIDTALDTLIYLDHKLESMTLPKLLTYLSPKVYYQMAHSVIITLTIFIILFAIFFSYCSIAKIRIKETGNIKESMNFINLTKIIMNKGIKKYLTFVILTFIVFAILLLLMKTLESYFFIGSVISAFSEAFALFFILDSFSLFYRYS